MYIATHTHTHISLICEFFVIHIPCVNCKFIFIISVFLLSNGDCHDIWLTLNLLWELFAYAANYLSSIFWNIGFETQCLYCAWQCRLTWHLISDNTSNFHWIYHNCRMRFFGSCWWHLHLVSRWTDIRIKHLRRQLIMQHNNIKFDWQTIQWNEK